MPRARAGRSRTENPRNALERFDRSKTRQLGLISTWLAQKVVLFLFSGAPVKHEVSDPGRSSGQHEGCSGEHSGRTAGSERFVLARAFDTEL